MCLVWVGETFPAAHRPDYSAAYAVIETDVEDGLKGYGIIFTLGKGTEVGHSQGSKMLKFHLCSSYDLIFLCIYYLSEYKQSFMVYLFHWKTLKSGRI